MNLLSRVFRQGFDPGIWPQIVPGLVSHLAHAKRQWFNECVRSLEIGLMEDRDIRTKVVQPDLGGAAALAITAYQICRVKEMIVERSYIQRNNAVDFAALLLNHACGSQTDIVRVYMKRYEQVSGDEATQLFRLGTDIVSYITAEQAPMIVCLHAASVAQKLVTYTEIATASAFNDMATVKNLSRQC